MTNFLSFYKTSTPHTREHQQNPMRSMDRKHLNQVPRSKSQQAQDPLIDRIIKNDMYGKWNISYLTGQRLAKTYFGTHTDGQNYTKSINRTKIKLTYNAQTRKFNLERIKN
jgi:hypothetical protein